MSFKSESKPLNEEGSNALVFWTDSMNERIITGSHESFEARDIVNEYLSDKGLTANVYVGTNPKTRNYSMLVYSGLDGDFDFEGYVDWNPNIGHNMLLSVLELLGFKCYK